ncbi:MAG TPA: hypothetical protein VMT34_06715, partial [Aggregatilineales bacterium]|nr:hypothetical protein [Aggregatilineales bacterium]
HIPVSLLRPAVIVMQTLLPNPPVSTALLDLLAVPNVVTDNALVSRLGITPKPFTPENLAYMKDFRRGTTLEKFFGRSTEENKVRDTAMHAEL